jgi:hypothetical protein
VRILLGAGNIQTDGRPIEEQAMVENMLNHNWGTAVVMTIAVAILTSALVQFFYGISQGYKERVEMDRRSKLITHSIHGLAWYGYFSRGVILGITGFFLLKSGIEENAKEVVNTDKAFDFIGDHVGHFYFILIAVGTVCYGLFMWVQAFLYDSDKD